jgi:hypothetical protein
MSTIVTRYGKGSPLTWLEVDDNFTNLNTDKIQSGNTVAALTITSATINGGTINGTTVGASTASSGAFTTLSATGVTTVQAGTVSLPAITTTGDTNTGIFFPAADTIAFTEGGTEAMRINSSGQVGIGTTSPRATLAFAGTTSTAGVPNKIRLFDDGASNFYGFNISSGLLDIIGGTGGGVAIYTNGANERMRIDSAGNVGIGTTTTTYRTNIVYNNSAGGVAETGLYLRNTSTGNSTQIQLDGNRSFSLMVQGSFGAPAGGFTIQDNTAGATRLSIDSSGNVGIGTSSPGAKLDVAGTIRSTSQAISSSGVGVELVYNSAIPVGGVQAYDRSASVYKNLFIDGLTLLLQTNGTERMRIDTSGNVGIGTASPVYKLDVNNAVSRIGDSTGLGFLQLGSSATASNNFHIGDNAGAFIFYQGNYGAGTERMRIHSSGGVSIGNTTDSGAASLNVSGSMSGGYIAHANGTTAMAFGSDNVARVTPTATATFTSTVPAAGAICVLSILTSGTSSYTITFGTGFKATGTLATGTVSARYFNITFVSDGTNLIEMSRTTAIT